MSPATTRSQRSDTLDVQALADWRSATSPDTDIVEMRAMARRYHIQVRAGAGSEAIRAQLLRLLEPRIALAETEAETPDAPPSSSPSLSASVSSPSLSSQSSLSYASASELTRDPQQQPAAQQRLQPGEEPPAIASQLSAASSTQAAASSQPITHAQYFAVLQRCMEAEDEADRLLAENVELRADRVCLVVQVQEVITLDIRVWDATLAPSDIRLPASSGLTASSGLRHTLRSGKTADTPPTPASGPAAAATDSPHSPQQQQQQPAPAQPSSREWVFSGLPLAASSSRDAAHAAVSEFASQRLGMADAAQTIQVVRVSSQRAGVAIVRLADRDTERALRSAKALLLGDCPVSIFRSLPPEQRSAAAMLRQARRQQQLLAPEEVAAARRAAEDALEFARRHAADKRRSPRHRAFCSPPAAAPLGAPSRFSVLHDESAPDGPVPDAETPAEGSTPPTAAAAANLITATATARTDVC